LTDVVANGDFLADGQVISAQNGEGELNLGSTSNEVYLTNDAGKFAKGWWYANNTDMQTGFGGSNWIEANATRVQMRVGGSSTFFAIQESKAFFRNSQSTLTSDQSTFRLFDNDTGAVTLLAGGSSKSVSINHEAATFNANVSFSVALGVSGGTVKTGNVAYVTNVGFIGSGHAFESVLSSSVLTADRTATLQDASGTIAYLSDFDTGQIYTPSNVTTTRTFDADATTLAELADVVGTMIADLQGINILS
jgi:hypothetical protein